eukprot:6706375-Karenia_brevis.AAC.1
MHLIHEDEVVVRRDEEIWMGWEGRRDRKRDGMPKRSNTCSATFLQHHAQCICVFFVQCSPSLHASHDSTSLLPSPYPKRSSTS